MMTRVLFVDQEPRVLDGLRRQLRCFRHEWEMDFHSSVPDALAAMTASPFDVVVTDTKMSGAEGDGLLTQISRDYPEAVRIVLSGQADRDAIIESVGVAHQYLAKPCEPEVLRATIARACTLRQILQDPALKSLVSGIDALPSLPSLYHELTSALQREESTLAAIGSIVQEDIGMTAQILKIVNSAFFGIKREIADIPTAISYLGLDTIRALVLSGGVFRQFEGRGSEVLSLEALWSHSQRTAHLARALGKAEGFEKKEIDQIFVSAMMHDVGRLVLVNSAPDVYRQVLQATEQGPRLSQAEGEAFGANHGALGGYLMGLWGLPDAVVEGVTYHLTPECFPVDEISQSTLVHVADSFAQKPWDPGIDLETHPLNVEHLDRIGAIDRIADWGQHCNKVLEGGNV